MQELLVLKETVRAFPSTFLPTHTPSKAVFVVLGHSAGCKISHMKRHKPCTVSEQCPWCTGRLRGILEEGSRACDLVSPGHAS